MATQHSGAFTDLGKVEDLYYTDPDNCKVEAIPVEYNTRFTQAFSNPGSGTSTFIIPPGNGLKHVVIQLGYNAGGGLAGQTGNNALPAGWGYSAIQQISFRIGGSSQYFLTGQQLLAKVLRQVRTQTQAQALLNLGGLPVGTNVTYGTAGTGDFALNQYAYIVVPIWCLPGADGLNVPLPADTLAQQVQVTCTLNPASSFWVNNGTAGAPPAAFDVATFQVEQLCMVDRGMAIANHVDLNTHELLMPIIFDQQELQVPIPAQGYNTVAKPFPASLTGFRSGQVKTIQCWLTKDADTANPNHWYAPAAVTVLYAGTIYADYRAGSSVIFNTLDGTKPPQVSTTALTINAGAAFTSSSVQSQYCLLPFANPTGDDYSAEVLTHGKAILNGLVNLQVVVPTNEAYTLHVTYVYNSTLVFSKSSAEFRF
jgi:hypothetical protein